MPLMLINTAPVPLVMSPRAEHSHQVEHRETVALPLHANEDFMIADNKTADQPSIVNPSATLRSMFPAELQRSPYRYVGDGAMRDVEGYTMEAVSAVRSNDVAALRSLVQRGESLDVCNRNGETLLHLACRRGDVETVLFLINKAQVPVDVHDGLGRTVLHDVCWRPTPDMQLMDALLQTVSPQLLLAQDMRGHTPFDYTRHGDWAQWNEYLQERREFIEQRAAAVVH